MLVNPYLPGICPENWARKYLYSQGTSEGESEQDIW